ncbi:MAG: polyphosphate kinase 1 [Acidimicrobiia bacterium]|nr:polyphosphate kinase 1 [Acidimicrobiia bacterium]MDH4307865.1 polyphosphate kinase 1 [Acidimicrobiia bacterium]MDH5292736.1 polyphosphate kinase 1 [Acidimicrobiia bacterium]
MASDRLINRELSWLDFNARVMALAEQSDIPLMERVRFLAIWADNLDEFYMVRVAGLLEQMAHGLRAVAADGLSSSEQLAAIRKVAAGQYERASAVFNQELLPGLAKSGIQFSDYESLDGEDREFVDRQFRERVFPVVTPLAVDPSHPFPYISNLSLNLAIIVRNPESGVTRFARIKVPPILPRFLVMPDGERFIPLENVIAAHADEMFPGMEIVEHHAFRVTRNADLEIEEDQGGDLLQTIESELTRRRFGRVVRLEVHPSMSHEVLDLLTREMGLDPSDVVVVDGPLDMSGLFVLGELDRPELYWDQWQWITQPRLAGGLGESNDVFGTIRSGDVLVQHPYDSFATSVEAFIGRAARDPNVLAIKMTLYRTSRNSPIMAALMEAATEGKQVVALVELKARFDEERNIEWAQRLEDAGVHVVYGVVGLKTHTKIALVVRDEGGALKRYAHIGTGNYNDTTARIYEDVGLFTADPDIGADLTDLFNFLTGYSYQRGYRKLLVSPVTVRSQLLAAIAAEAERSDGHITMKMNSLVDPGMIEALYDASNAGCRIDLIVRGICCLIPGVPGMSENITVRSIVGRYLEHSRIYRFGARGRDRRYYIGSADLMPRNLDRRVEALAPVEDSDLQFRLDEILEVSLADDVLSWELGADGQWRKVEPVHYVDAHLTMRGLAEARAGARAD